MTRKEAEEFVATLDESTVRRLLIESLVDKAERDNELDDMKSQMEELLVEMGMEG